MSDLHTEKPAENQGFPGLNGHDPASNSHAAETAAITERQTAEAAA